MDSRQEEIFYFSLHMAMVNRWDLSGEQYALDMSLDRALRQTGIIHSIQKYTSLYGKIDFCVMKDKENISILCVSKSTHDLLLPMTAEACKAAYDRADEPPDNGGDERSTEWHHVAHPIRQLICYMVDNQHHFGALTSGTRTYFLKIQGPEGTTSGSTCRIGNEDAADHQWQGDGTDHVVTSKQAKKLKTNDDVPLNVAQDKHNEVHGLESHSRHSAQHCMGNPKAGNDTNREMTGNQKVATCTSDKSHGNVPSESDVLCAFDNEMKVYISDAWCVGEANYLRAWSYMHTLHERTVPGPWRAPPNSWRQQSFHGQSTPRDETNPVPSSTTSCDIGGDVDNSLSGGPVTSYNRQYYYPLYHDVVDFVPLDDIVVVGVCGDGRNGTCYKVKWNGMECAMKQFDIVKDGDVGFEKEIRAYKLLRKAWGTLVPRPMFLSETFSGTIMLLGLQLGHDTENVEDLPKFDAVLERLKKEYGIQHNDAEQGRNMLIITDSDGNERVVAIDFEDWFEVKHKKLSQWGDNFVAKQQQQQQREW
jgi:predicted Ser/Thr protein kinase